MKNPMVVIRRIVRKSSPTASMTIRGGIRDRSHKAPWIRNALHKIKRFFGIASVLLAVTAKAGTLPSRSIDPPAKTAIRVLSGGVDFSTITTAINSISALTGPIGIGTATLGVGASSTTIKGVVVISTGYKNIIGNVIVPVGNATLEVGGVTSTTFLSLGGANVGATCSTPDLFLNQVRNTGFAWNAGGGTMFFCNNGTNSATLTAAGVAGGNAGSGLWELGATANSATTAGLHIRSDAGTGITARTTQGIFAFVSSGTPVAIIQSTGGTIPSQASVTFLAVTSTTFLGQVLISTGYLNGSSALGDATLEVVGVSSSTQFMAGYGTTNNPSLAIGVRNTGYNCSTGSSCTAVIGGNTRFTATSTTMSGNNTNGQGAIHVSGTNSTTAVGHTFIGDLGTGMTGRTTAGRFAFVSSTTIVAVVDSTGAVPGPASASWTFPSITTVTFQGGILVGGAATFNASAPVTFSSAVFVGLAISTIAAGGAGASVTAVCPAGNFATGGGCNCTGGVAVTGTIADFNCLTAGCVPTGFTCQEPGGTGGACSAYVMCSRAQ